MNRRSFLSSCLALAAAPAIVRADSLMRIVPREAVIVGAGVPHATYVVCSTFSNSVMEFLVFNTTHDEQTRLKVVEYLERKHASLADREHLVVHYLAQEHVAMPQQIWTAAHD